ncbi:uncharacterized protein [Onthophagus taurus]|uniref:uncharacterized protein n=1 Tax=Onthophagus taurus TaxID=166361 RepID=UPI0039BEBE2F
MSFNDNKKFWSEFIEIYRDQRSLWDVKHKNYSNKHLRKEGYTALIDKTKEIFPDCEEKFVKAKVESLRASFRRELKKVQSSKRTGSGQDDVYEPSLWYYDLMVFTSDQEVARKGVSSLEKRKRDEVPLEDEEESGEDKLEERVTTLDDSSRGFEASVPTVSSAQCVTLSDSSAPSTSAACTQKRATRKKRNVSALDKKQENFLDAATTVLTI